MLFWQLPIQSIQDNYIVIVICALINLLYGSWGNGEAILNSSLAAITLVFLAIYPVYMQLYLYRRRDMLKKASFIRKYGAAYTNLRIIKDRFMFYPLIFYYRRLLLPFVILYFSRTLSMQFIAMMITGMVTIVAIIVRKPFKDANWFELSHEIVILLIMYHVFCFTDFVPDPEIRYLVGWSVIVVTVTHLIFFYSVTIYGWIKAAIRSYKLSYYQK